ncbi:hypothetical protein PBY51_004131 [Eleginops maclovinus]|uniref:Secreted protein n=1 Tax=Eleginops maclovinus TaxID=56733 RepID=A0AAN7Y258_ELEMC|nr:hypothetical protein PBY51_004131 [Eleginops maclovinus]
MGILIGTQICACLIVATKAKSSYPFSPPAMCTGWHKGRVVLCLQDAQDAQCSCHQVCSLLLWFRCSRLIRPPCSTWRPISASLNNIPADPSSH